MRRAAVRLLVFLALGIGELYTPSPWRFFLFVGLFVYFAEWLGLRSRIRLIEVARRQRHRTANQMQVLSGWLQLGMVERADEYLDQMMEQSRSQGLWFRGFPSQWSYMFLLLDAEAEFRAIQLTWEGLESVRPTRGFSWMIQMVVRQAMDVAEGTIQVRLSDHTLMVRVPGAQNTPKNWMYWNGRWKRMEDGVYFVPRLREGTELPELVSNEKKHERRL